MQQSTLWCRQVQVQVRCSTGLCSVDTSRCSSGAFRGPEETHSGAAQDSVVYRCSDEAQAPVCRHVLVQHRPLQCRLLLFFFSIFFWRARVCRPLLCLCRPFMIFLRDVWIRTQSAAVASWCATDLATHPSIDLATHPSSV